MNDMHDDSTRYYHFFGKGDTLRPTGYPSQIKVKTGVEQQQYQSPNGDGNKEKAENFNKGVFGKISIKEYSELSRNFLGKPHQFEAKNTRRLFQKLT